MSITIRKGSGGKRQIHVYDPVKRQKRYVGMVGPCSRPGANPRLCRCKECAIARDTEHKALELLEQDIERQWTVSRWAAFWLEECHGEGTTRPETTTWRHNKERVSAFVDEHGPKLIGSVTVDDAARLTVEAPHRAKSVRAMFNDAVRRGRVKASPFAAVMAPKQKGRQDITPLSEAEVKRIVEIATDKRPLWLDFPALLTVAAWAGLRPGELCGLEWTEVDLRRGVLVVEFQRRNDGSRGKVKADNYRPVPLGEAARDALLTLKRDLAGPVFKTPTGKELRPNSLRHYWQPVRDAFTAELTGDHWLKRRLRHNPKDLLDPYELRHYFGSVLADQGLSARDISRVMGNTPAVCERVYLHHHEDRVQRRVLDALNRASGSNVAELTVATSEGAGVGDAR